MGLKSFIKNALVSQKVSEQLDKLEKPIGSLGYDPWGFNKETSKVALSLFGSIYEKYFRVETNGLDHIPNSGPVLIIANHSGQLPLDGTLIAYAVTNREQHPRYPRAMIERFFPTVPFLGNFLNQVGAVLGDPSNCARMLENDEAVIVFPEGVRGSGKLFKDRYKLQRFGNGFVHLAMKHKTPIVPVGVVGCEETIPAVANIKPLAKMLGVPYVPLALPLIFPSKVVLNFGKPIYFENEDLTEEQVTRRVEKVKTSISSLIAKGLEQRQGVFS